MKQAATELPHVLQAYGYFDGFGRTTEPYLPHHRRWWCRFCKRTWPEGAIVGACDVG